MESTLIRTGLVLITLTTTSVCTSDCRDDIVFLLDESGSVSLSNFDMMRNFIIDFIRDLNIGPLKTQISILTFSSDVNFVFQLREYNYTYALVQAIANITYNSGNTLTELALEYAYNYTFLASNGGREGSTRLLVLITDGQSRCKRCTIDAANKLKDEGVNIVAVGVGPGINYEELHQASTNNYVLNASSFDHLHTIRNELNKQVCLHNFECRHKPTDIMFIVDTTTEDETVIQTLNNEIQNIASNLPDNTTFRIAVVGISFEPLLIKDFSDFTNTLEIMKYFRGINHTRAPIFTEKGLRMAANKFSTDYSRDRYAILIYNGMSTFRQDTESSAKYLSTSSGGITVMVIGNGVYVDQRELLQVASSPNYVFAPNRYDIINTILIETSTHCNDCIESSFTDILFMIDASSSNSVSEFHSFLNTLVKLADLFLENLNDTKIGLTSFSNDVRTSFKLDDTVSKGFVREKVNQLRHEETTAQPSNALEYARLHGFEVSNGGRVGSRKFVILFSNARWYSLNQIKFESNLLRENNVTVVTVGVGREVNVANYVGIASSAYHSYLVFDDDYTSLEAIVSDTKYVVCGD